MLFNTIDAIDISVYKPTLDLENKINLGEVQTPYAIANELLNMLPSDVFLNKSLKWCEPGAGQGNISVVLFNKLVQGLIPLFSSVESCKTHILSMITLIEINHTNENRLIQLFGPTNVFCKNFLQLNYGEKYDIIFGNPPFNTDGAKKVPTNTNMSKLSDGKTAWCDFVVKSMEMLNDDGYLCFIIPCIWMKPDKANVYKLLTSYKICKIKCFTNTETNAMFYGQAQTPSVFVVVQKTINMNNNSQISIFDKINDKYVDFMLFKDMPIPHCCPSIISKIYSHTQRVGPIKVYKTNMPPKHVELSDTKRVRFSYVNIKTCTLSGNKPTLEYLYSTQPGPYHKIPKIVMAHGMYGFPYIDRYGSYGVANRDKYIITDKSYRDMQRLSTFLSTKSCLLFFEATKYRMKYLEKYIFEYIPDITKIEDFPKNITDETIADFFGFNEIERNAIQKLFKEYGRFH